MRHYAYEWKIYGHRGADQDRVLARGLRRAKSRDHSGQIEASDGRGEEEYGV